MYVSLKDVFALISITLFITCLTIWADILTGAGSGPAKTQEIQAKIDELADQRASVQFSYDYSPWAMGPRYRAHLQEIDAELSRLKLTLPAEMQEAAQ